MDRFRERVFAEIADGNDETTAPLEVSGEDRVTEREESVFVGGSFTTAAPLVAWRASNAVRSRCTRGRTASAAVRGVSAANRGLFWIAATAILGLSLAALGLFGIPSRVLGPQVTRNAIDASAGTTPVAATAPYVKSANAASLDGRYAGRALDLRHEGRYVGVSIRDLPVATWILAKNPETPGNAGFDYGQVDPAELRIVRLRLEKPDGGLLHIDKLAFAASLSADGLAQGAWMYVEYEELGIANYGEIREIRRCPPIPPRPSPDHCLVTAKFEHSAGDLLNLHVDGLDEPLGVTPNHPIWSEDRQQFVRADELDQGETLRTAHDQHVRVASLAHARESAAVYNLEVDGEHVYYVTRAGVLVHNSGTDYRGIAPNSGASNVNAAAALSKKLSALEDAQKTAARTRNLPDGRIRYFEAEKLARNPGPTRGASFVTEWDPKTRTVRQWMESYDHAGNVVRVHPKTLNGQDLISPHFPPTGKELGQ